LNESNKKMSYKKLTKMVIKMSKFSWMERI
jgi:hypothetical protein